VADDPRVLPALAQCGRERVLSRFTWQAKARQVAQVYDWVLGPGDAMPELLPSPSATRNRT
jgi:hypothetical protein